MFSFLRRHIRTIVVLVILFISLLAVVISSDGKWAAPPGSGLIARIFIPPVTAAHHMIDNIVYGLRNLGKDRTLLDERNILKQENKQLRMELAGLREAAAENERLTALLDFKEKNTPEMVGSRVLRSHLDEWVGAILIDRGKADGLTRDQAVFAGSGVVGQVVEIYPHTAIVLLLVNRNMAAGAQVQRSRFAGIVQGNGDYKHLTLLLEGESPDVQEGDIIITSGLGGVYPKGIPIGKVDKLFDPEGLMRRASITPFVDYAHLEEVLVMTGPGEEQAPPEESAAQETNKAEDASEENDKGKEQN